MTRVKRSIPAAPLIAQGVSDADIVAYGKRCYDKGFRDSDDGVVEGLREELALRQQEAADQVERLCIVAEELESLVTTL